MNFKYLTTFILLYSLSFNTKAEEDHDFICRMDVLESHNNLKPLFTDTWLISDTKKKDDIYHHLVYKEIENYGMNMSEKVHIFYQKEDVSSLYLKLDINFNYRDKITKKISKKNFSFKDKVSIGNRSNYSNGQQVLTINCKFK
jgi:hypothetical protein